MILRIALAFFASAVIAAPFAIASAPLITSAKASRVVLEKMVTDESQDVIVVFDDGSITQDALTAQAKSGKLSSHADIIELKAARFQKQKNDVHAQLDELETTVLKEYSHLPITFLRVHSKAALARLIAHPGVVGIYENRLDQLFLEQSLPLIGQPQVAAQGYLGNGTSVAVLDTGVDYTRAAFGSCTAPGVGANCRVVVAQDYVTGDGQLDSNGHGTNVAGIVLGVAPAAKVLALRVCNQAGCDLTAQLNAIDFAIQNKNTYNVVALNLSLGGGRYTSALTNDPRYVAFTQARAAGILPVVASGNDAYTNAMASPGAVVGAVSVGAVYDSNIGPKFWRIGCQDLVTNADLVTCFSNSAPFLTLDPVSFSLST